MRRAFPTAIDYYEVLRPRLTASDAAIPSLVSQGRLGRFSCSVGMSLPGLRRHLYTGGSILKVVPLYPQATLVLRVLLSYWERAS